MFYIQDVTRKGNSPRVRVSTESRAHASVHCGGVSWTWRRSQFSAVTSMQHELFKDKLVIDGGLIRNEVFGSSRSVDDSALLNKR